MCILGYHLFRFPHAPQRGDQARHDVVLDFARDPPSPSTPMQSMTIGCRTRTRCACNRSISMNKRSWPANEFRCRFSGPVISLTTRKGVVSETRTPALMTPAAIPIPPCCPEPSPNHPRRDDRIAAAVTTRPRRGASFPPAGRPGASTAGPRPSSGACRRGR